MASSNQTPDVLFSPIAANADASDINTIPQTYDPANYGYAAQNVGFPTECRLPVLNPDGTLGQGRAPRMQDWNGIMKLVSSHNFFLQNGGSYTFNPTVSSNIGGYPKNAVLWYFPENEAPCLVYSLINDNTNNFVDDPTLIDGIHWEMLVNPSSYANIALTNSPYTTNRILEIPQDIKLELNNGTLTLKAGSKVYVPNGFEEDGTTPKFDVITIESDLTKAPYGYAVQTLVFVNPSNTGIYDLYTEQCYSGTVAPTASPTMIWYDTANNLVKRTSNSGSTWTSGLSLPVGLVTSTTTAYTSVDLVFNCVGFIGSAKFALPSIKVQGAFGVNEDGTYKLKTFTLDRVLIELVASGLSGRYGFGYDILEDGTITYFGAYANEIKVGEKQPSGENFAWWNPVKGETHYVKSSGIDEKIPHCPVRLGLFTASNGRISSMVQNPIDSIVTSNALNFSQAGRRYLSSLSTPAKSVELTLLASGSNYTAPANGWFRVIANPNVGTYMRLVSNYLAPIYSNNGSGAVDAELSVRVAKGDTVTYNYVGSFYNTNRILFIYDRGDV